MVHPIFSNFICTYNNSPYIRVVKPSQCRFSQCLYFSTSALARKVEKLSHDIWKQVGLAPSHAYILILALEEPGIQPGSIAHQVQLKPSTVTRLLEKLEDMKLVVRTSAGKMTNVYPTPKATNLMPQLQICLQAFQEKYKAILGGQDSRIFVEQVNRMSDLLD